MSSNLNAPPGDSYVSTSGIVAITLYLIILAIMVMIGIGTQWPTCVLPGETSNTNTNANEHNSNAAGANTNAQGNANAVANSNSNANSNANTNSNNANDGGAANTNSPGNTNVAGGTGTIPAAGSPGGEGAATPDIDSVEPKSGPITGNTSVTVKGKGLAKGDVLKFDGTPAKISSVSAESISARTPPHEEGIVNVTIERGGEVQDILTNEYEYTCPAPSGPKLFFLIVLAGALGGIVHAGFSLYWYVGNRELKWSWMLMYIFLPFGGAAIAIIFYLVILAGLLPSAPGRNISLFVVAVAALVGMFSKQAQLKLTDIANAFFTKPAKGEDAKPQGSEPVSAKDAQATAKQPEVDPASGPKEGGTSVKIKNTGLTSVKSVTFATATATGFEHNATTSTIDGVTPPNPSGEAEDVDVVITDAADKSVTVKFKYT